MAECDFSSIETTDCITRKLVRNYILTSNISLSLNILNEHRDGHLYL
jgi:hypothetical protein